MGELIEMYRRPEILRVNRHVGAAQCGVVTLQCRFESLRAQALLAFERMNARNIDRGAHDAVDRAVRRKNRKDADRIDGAAFRHRVGDLALLGRAGLENAAFDRHAGVVLGRRKNVVVGAAEHLGGAFLAARTEHPGVAKLGILGEDVDIGAAQRGLEPRLGQIERAGELGDAVFEIEPQCLEFAHASRSCDAVSCRKRSFASRTCCADGSFTRSGSIGSMKATVTTEKNALPALTKPVNAVHRIPKGDALRRAESAPQSSMKMQKSQPSARCVARNMETMKDDPEDSERNAQKAQRQ